MFQNVPKVRLREERDTVAITLLSDLLYHGDMADKAIICPVETMS